jgi:two-component system, chemotaxis family, sensor kinase Cph1
VPGESLSTAFKTKNSQNHTCAFYETPTDRLRILANYYKTGLDRGELCIFITDQVPRDLIKKLKRYGLDAAQAVADGDLRIFPVKPTYLEDGTFKAPRMLDNLKNFVKQALAQGYNGVRGGGDMAWLAGRPPGWQDITRYEAKINLFIRGHRFTGICLFPRDLLDSDFTQKIIQTHQGMVRSGRYHDNPYYEPVEVLKGLHREITANVQKIEKWLEKIDEAPAASTV